MGLNRFSKRGIPLPPEVLGFRFSARQFFAPEIGANACPVNLTKSSRRSPIKHGKRSKLKRVSPLFADTSL